MKMRPKLTGTHQFGSPASITHEFECYHKRTVVYSIRSFVRVQLHDGYIAIARSNTYVQLLYISRV